MTKKGIKIGAAVVVALALPLGAFAATVTDFESFTLGSVNGQGGWSSTGPFDQAVVTNSYGYTSFGTKTFRLSNGVASGSFGDQTFSASVANEAGETTAVNSGMSGGTRQPHFEAEFDIASTMPNEEQPGLTLSVSPDRGDGARMSYLRFEDKSDGVHVYFDDFVGTSFVETDIATLDRSVAHKIKFSMDFIDGAANDIVKIYIDGALVHTGTSWEDYFRVNQPDIAPPTVDSLLFRAGGTSVPANLGKGFLFDNVSLDSGPIVVVPPPSTGPASKDECKKDGWKSFTNPSFKNQGQCVSSVASNR